MFWKLTCLVRFPCSLQQINNVLSGRNPFHSATAKLETGLSSHLSELTSTLRPTITTLPRLVADCTADAISVLLGYELPDPDRLRTRKNISSGADVPVLFAVVLAELVTPTAVLTGRVCRVEVETENAD